ncbi:MAG TPA: hypothetical protein VFU88_04985 [Ktedonobacterales bacterium]|nr:hypothetical protein [Ktedonobacterales bacterium]
MDPLTLGLLGPYALGVVWMALRGGRMLVSGQRYVRAQRVGPDALAGWTALLERLGALDSERDAENELRADLILRWVRLTGRALIGRGAGTLVGCALAAIVTAALFAPQAALDDVSRTLRLDLAALLSITLGLCTIIVAGDLVGQSIGAARGLAELPPAGHRAAGPAASAGNLEDYRSPIWQAGLAALAVASLALFVAIGPLGLYTPSLPQELEPALPWLRALLWVSTLGPPLVLLAGEVASRMLVRLPFRSFSWSRTVSLRADALYRGQALGTIVAVEIEVAGLLLFLPWAGVLPLVVISTSADALTAALAGGGALLLALIAAGVARSVSGMQGHLGGRLTGWPRQTHVRG